MPRASALPCLPPLTRQQALSRVCRLARRTTSRRAEMVRWITLFGLQPEELLEAGLHYETVKGLEAFCINLAG